MQLTAILRATFGATAVVVLGGVLAACGGSDDAPTFKPLTLNLAHINDHHSQLDAFANTTFTVDGVATQADLGGFARQAAAFKALDGTPNLLKIHAGDALTGTLYYTFFQGAADAQMMNAVCFDAFTPGNHEFDDGDGRLKSFLDELAKGSCKTSIVSSNVRPAAGSPLAPNGAPAYLQPWVIKEVDGVKVGLIGITIAGKTTNSSRPLDATVFLNEAAAAQQAIDALKAQGVRHIVAITHQGYSNDKALAAQLTDVDVIIGGDSHTLLGDFSAVGISTASGAYPTVVTNKNGETVCIGQAWEYAKALGLLKVTFNDAGAVASGSARWRRATVPPAPGAHWTRPRPMCWPPTTTLPRAKTGTPRWVWCSRPGAMSIPTCCTPRALLTMCWPREPLPARRAASIRIKV